MCGGKSEDALPGALRNNPGKTASPYNLQEHPYLKGQGDPNCPECRRQGLVHPGRRLSDDNHDGREDELCPLHRLAAIDSLIRERKRQYNDLSNDYTGVYFDDRTGGYVATHKKRFPNKKYSKKHELWQIYYKEESMAKVLANRGHIVDLIPEPRTPGGKPDALIDGVLTEFKRLSTHNTIFREVSDAFENKHAEMIVIEFTKRSKEISEQLRYLHEKRVNGYYYYDDDPSTLFRI